MSLSTGFSLDSDILEIVNKPNPSKRDSEFEVIVHTPYEDIKVTKLLLIETMRNYSKYVGDVIIVTFNLTGGTFIKDVYPYRDNLEMTIVEYDRSSLKTYSDNRYKLVLINNGGNVYGSKYTSSTRDHLDNNEYIRVEGQCINRIVEGLRLIQVEGIYENTLLKDIVYAELTEKIKNLQLDGKASEFGIDMIEPSNNNEIKQLVIPSGIYALDFPSYLQNASYGIYNGGIGTYVQSMNNKDYVFIYPLYDVNRFDQTEYKAIIYFTTSAKFNYMDNTYNRDGTVLKILAGTSLRSLDNAENDFMSQGDGFIRVIPEQMMNRNVVVQGDTMNLDASSHLEGTKFKDRTDGVDKPIFLGNEKNMYKYRSEINKNSLGTYQFTWHYSNPELIYPGMPIQYVFEDNYGNIYKLTGVIQLVVSKYDNALRNTSSSITFMAQKPIVYGEDTVIS